ncbi:hypothetical protein KUCAC02_016679 [Chaenocephalus aceratus]|nr:hypothetical protein KUCAC02_016675 [Chaenocephalus aceratus]KAI4799783.1 hypothetical protein KUCAC02_016679 [Chaenocephalus aceratus]
MTYSVSCCLRLLLSPSPVLPSCSLPLRSWIVPQVFLTPLRRRDGGRGGSRQSLGTRGLLRQSDDSEECSSGERYATSFSVL